MSIRFGIYAHFGEPRLASDSEKIFPVCAALPLGVVDHAGPILASMQRGRDDARKLAKGSLRGTNPRVDQLPLALWLTAKDVNQCHHVTAWGN